MTPINQNATVSSKLLNLFAQVWCKDNSFKSPFVLHDQAILMQFQEFDLNLETNYLRSNLSAHFTGSALVTNQTLDRVLLTHHRKLNLWLQLGGHADGNTNLADVAFQEGLEESGYQELSLLPLLVRDGFNVPFDLDVHEIGTHRDVPAHRHFDVRFIYVTDDTRPPVISDESHDLRWFTLDEAREVTQEASMLRQFKKLELIKTSQL